MRNLFPHYPGPPLLRYLTSSERVGLFSHTETYGFSAGERVVYQTDNEGVLYLLERGSAEVVTIQGDQRVPLAVLQPGQVFGEGSFLTGQRRVADVFALEECRIRFFEAESIREFFRKNEGICAKFFLALSQIQAARMTTTIQRFTSSDQLPAVNFPANFDDEEENAFTTTNFPDSQEFESESFQESEEFVLPENIQVKLSRPGRGRQREKTEGPAPFVVDPSLKK